MTPPARPLPNFVPGGTKFRVEESEPPPSARLGRAPFQAIAAMALNRVIGCRNQIPWHLPEDFRWFKQVTLHHVLLMGRKTFESIGRPLPGRQTIVLTRSGWTHPDVATAPSLEALPLAPDDPRTVFLCGGAEVYAQGLPHCSDLYLTRVKREVAGDAFFPPFEDRFTLVAELRDTPDFTILHYRNRLLTEGAAAAEPAFPGAGAAGRGAGSALNPRPEAG